MSKPIAYTHQLLTSELGQQDNRKYAGPGVGDYLYVFRDEKKNVIGVGRKGRNREGLGRYVHQKISGGHRMGSQYGRTYDVIVFEMNIPMNFGGNGQAGLNPRADWLEASLIDDPRFQKSIMSWTAHRGEYDPTSEDQEILAEMLQKIL